MRVCDSKQSTERKRNNATQRKQQTAELYPGDAAETSGAAAAAGDCTVAGAGTVADASAAVLATGRRESLVSSRPRPRRDSSWRWVAAVTGPLDEARGGDFSAPDAAAT